MTTENISQVVNFVASQVLLRARDIEDFRSWLKAGNYEEEADIAETRCRKGLDFSFSQFAMGAFSKFNS